MSRAFLHGDSRDPFSAFEVRAKAARCVAADLSADRPDTALPALTGLRLAPDCSVFASGVTT